MGRKRTKNTYWFDEQDKAVDEYNSETKEWKKQRIFNEKLYYPLFRLAEYMVNTKSCEWIQMSRRQKIDWLISEMTVRLKSVDGDSNPFSYLYLTAHHALMNKNIDAYEEVKSHRSLEDEETYVMTLPATETSDEVVEDQWNDLFTQMVEQLESNRHKLKLNPAGNATMDELIQLFQNAEHWPLETFKKDITNYLKESTGYSSQSTRPLLNTLRPIIKRMVSNYFHSGNVDQPQELMWLDRPPSTVLPKILKNDSLFDEVFKEMSDRPLKHIFEERNFGTYPYARQTMIYGNHYKEEMRWE